MPGATIHISEQAQNVEYRVNRTVRPQFCLHVEKSRAIVYELYFAIAAPYARHGF